MIRAKNSYVRAAAGCGRKPYKHCSDSFGNGFNQFLVSRSIYSKYMLGSPCIHPFFILNVCRSGRRNSMIRAKNSDGQKSAYRKLHKHCSNSFVNGSTRFLMPKNLCLEYMHELLAHYKKFLDYREIPIVRDGRGHCDFSPWI